MDNSHKKYCNNTKIKIFHYKPIYHSKGEFLEEFFGRITQPIYYLTIEI